MRPLWPGRGARLRRPWAGSRGSQDGPGWEREPCRAPSFGHTLVLHKQGALRGAVRLIYRQRLTGPGPSIFREAPAVQGPGRDTGSGLVGSLPPVAGWLRASQGLPLRWGRLRRCFWFRVILEAQLRPPHVSSGLVPAAVWGSAPAVSRVGDQPPTAVASSPQHPPWSLPLSH